MVNFPWPASSNANWFMTWFLKFDVYKVPKQMGQHMTTLGGGRNAFVDKSVGVASGKTRTDNIWVETAWAVLEITDGLGDEATIEACQRVIDDDSDGELPAQSDVNIIFGFLDVHAH
jgi:hypothetical protein